MSLSNTNKFRGKMYHRFALALIGEHDDGITKATTAEERQW